MKMKVKGYDQNRNLYCASDANNALSNPHCLQSERHPHQHVGSWSFQRGDCVHATGEGQARASAVAAATLKETELAEAQRRIAEMETRLAASASELEASGAASAALAGERDAHNQSYPL